MADIILPLDEELKVDYENIVLQTSDGKAFGLPVGWEQSKLISTAIELFDSNPSKDSLIVRLNRVNSLVWGQIVDYLLNPDGFDVSHFNLKNELIPLYNTASYLDIDSLYKVLGKEIASRLQNKSVKELEDLLA